MKIGKESLQKILRNLGMVDESREIHNMWKQTLGLHTSSSDEETLFNYI
jgi:hypothetical protein